MRVLALDYGSARCGCALSDSTGTIATPIETVENPTSRRGMAALRTLIETREVQRVIVGLPLSLSGTETAQTRETRSFAQRLESQLAGHVPVEMHDERFTTRMAERMDHASSSEDSLAAALLLESWLQKKPRSD
ncbi:MAG: Holliday junction resolvase RuvX [Solirubrobacteraceae bacterium]